MKTRILTTILILCLLFSCVACGEPSPNDNTTDPSGTTAPSTAPEEEVNYPSAPPVDPDKVALKVNGMDVSAIALNYFYADAINVVAKRAGLTEGGAKSLLHRLRSSLKRHLEQEGIVL